MKNIYFAILLLLATSALKAQVNLTDSLYLYYKMDNDAQDYSGKQRHGNIHKSTGTTDRCGNPNSALAFNGVDSWITIHPALQDMTSYTLHAWVYYNDTTKAWRTIFSDSDPTIYKDLFWSITDTLVEVIYDKTADGAAGTVYSNKSFFNSWHQLVWVNTGNVSQIYVDTILVSTINKAGQNIGYHDTSYIGKMCDGNNSLRFFKGKLDEFRIYNRALNTAEIAALYNLSCELSSLGEGELADAIRIFPNPASEYLQFDIGTSAEGTVQVFNALGQQLVQTSTKNPQLDIRLWPQGTYYICFTIGEQIIKKQFIKL